MDMGKGIELAKVKVEKSMRQKRMQEARRFHGLYGV